MLIHYSLRQSVGKLNVPGLRRTQRLSPSVCIKYESLIECMESRSEESFTVQLSVFESNRTGMPRNKLVKERRTKEIQRFFQALLYSRPSVSLEHSTRNSRTFH